MNGGKSFLVAPTTTTKKDNFLYYKVSFDKNIDSYVCLNQIRVVSKERVRGFYGNKEISLNTIDFLEIKNRINKYYLYSEMSAPPLLTGEEGVENAPRIDLNISNRENMSTEERRKKNVVILVGRSGSGKGTQGELVKQFIENCGQDGTCKNTVYYISTGQRFREFVSRDTYTSTISRKINENGGLQPEFLAVWNWSSILIDYIQDDGNIIFDGAPRKLHEAEVLDSAINFYGWHKPLVLEIDVDLDECVRRMLLRKRADDTEQVIRERLSWYDRDVVPMLEWYKANPKYNYHKINGNRTVDEIWDDIKNILEDNL
jgi:adenylate kinase